jgi:hypothetical protein
MSKLVKFVVYYGYGNVQTTDAGENLSEHHTNVCRSFEVCHRIYIGETMR